jgi:CAAX prenyl protease-like protein
VGPAVGDPPHQLGQGRQRQHDPAAERDAGASASGLTGLATLTTAPGPVSSAQIAAEWLLISPVGFVVEEVFFRGGLDTYLHAGEKGFGWSSAVFVSALWGLWHLNVQTCTRDACSAPS